MTVERKYGVLLLLLLSGVGIASGLLLHKYSWGVTTLVLQRCSIHWTALFHSGFHLGGLGLFVCSLLSFLRMVILLALSLYKTRATWSRWAIHAMTTVPPKLRSIIRQYHLESLPVMYTATEQHQAYAIGWLRPTVIISKGVLKNLTSAQLAAVVLHESYHVHHGHPAMLAWASMIQRVCFFLPSLADVITVMRYRFEVAADAYASSVQGTTKHVHAALRLVQPVQRENWVLAFASLSGKQRNAPTWNGGTVRRLAVSILSVVVILVLLWWPVGRGDAVVIARAGGEPAVQNRCDAVFARTSVPMSLRR